ncbi:MAG: zinc ABC transporter substrate-binding protein [Immundisolibacterales bacterium]|nr:zinc ABC transporter substrate-binding protein [Immundisolibacterales bacterium]
MNGRASVTHRTPPALAAAVFACAVSIPASADAGVRVAASIKPVHSLVSAVMAGVGEPHLIVRGASSPHDFSLRPSDAAVLEETAVVFLVDEHLEASLAASIEVLAGQARVVELALAKGLIRRPLRDGGAFEEDAHRHHDDDNDDRGHGRGDEGKDDHRAHGEDHDDEGMEHEPYDLHVWLDPVNAWAMARMIAATLAEADPANAGTYEDNAHALLHRLDELTEAIDAMVAPARGEPFIVFHDGYRYFEDRFGLTVVGSAVVNPERPPGVRRIRELRDKIRALDVTCVFDEPQFDQRLIATIVEGTPVRTGTLDPLGAGVENGPDLYFTVLRDMAASFRDCLAPGERE